MHVPDGFLDVPTSIAAGAVSVAGLTVAARRCRTELDERRVPLAALTAAFVFAVQMVNFPVAHGTSGHLMGGVLAAVLVGPWAGSICITTVLAVQALLFADGGLSALGVNVLNLALIGCWGGYAAFVAMRRLLGATDRSLPVAAGLAALVSVPLAAVAFTAQYALGGTTGIDLGAMAVAMVGGHLLIGIGEALITLAVLQLVLAARPDLVSARPRSRRLDAGPAVATS